MPRWTVGQCGSLRKPAEGGGAYGLQEEKFLAALQCDFWRGGVKNGCGGAAGRETGRRGLGFSCGNDGTAGRVGARQDTLKGKNVGIY